MTSLWWLALGLLALPLWWHRQRRQRVREEPLATARFLPRSAPQQLRVWRFSDRLLLLLRCLLLAAVTAWLADLVLPWRGDTVLVAPGADSAWVERQIKQAGFADAAGVALPAGDAFAWLARHAKEWRRDSRLLVLGEVPMPAQVPRSRHQVQVVAAPPAAVPAPAPVRVTVFSKQPAPWRALFAAIDGPRRYLVGETADPRAELIVWDLPGAPPPGLRAPLWWVVDGAAFSELKDAPSLEGMRYADSARGRLWSSPAWPPRDAGAARSLFENWQRLHYPPRPYAMPTQAIAPSPDAREGSDDGALHYTLTLVLLTLFAMERIMTHARRH